MMSPRTATARKPRKGTHAARMEAVFAAVEAVVATGVCPDCGAPLRRNLSLTGWWQCSQHGAPGFRADATRAPCSWQGFTRA